MQLKKTAPKTTLLLLLFFLLNFSYWDALAQDDQFSEANNLLFIHDHLTNVSEDTQLNYHFVKSGSIEPGFEDDIQLNLKPADKVEERGVSVQFFTGERNRWTPEFNGVRGNPLLTIYLQRDIHEMNRLTDGQWRHFQKRIKLALENDAKVEPVIVQFSGKEFQGKKITITPYLDDPYNKRFKKYAAKYYEFTLAEELPGMIYQINSVSPDMDSQSTESSSEKSPLISESVTLTEISSPEQKKD